MQDEGDYRPHSGLGRVGTAIACACVAALLFVHQTVADVPGPTRRRRRRSSSSRSPKPARAGRHSPPKQLPRLKQSTPTPRHPKSESATATPPPFCPRGHCRSRFLPAPGASAPSAHTNILFADIDVRYNEEGLASLYAIDDARIRKSLWSSRAPDVVDRFGVATKSSTSVAGRRHDGRVPVRRVEASPPPGGLGGVHAEQPERAPSLRTTRTRTAGGPGRKVTRRPRQCRTPTRAMKSTSLSAIHRGRRQSRETSTPSSSSPSTIPTEFTETQVSNCV